MRANITAFLPAMGFCGRLPALDLVTGIPPQERFSRENEGSASEAGGPDAYKLAVLLLVGASILTLF